MILRRSAPMFIDKLQRAGGMGETGFASCSIIQTSCPFAPMSRATLAVLRTGVKAGTNHPSSPLPPAAHYKASLVGKCQCSIRFKVTLLKFDSITFQPLEDASVFAVLTILSITDSDAEIKGSPISGLSSE